MPILASNRMTAKEFVRASIGRLKELKAQGKNVIGIDGVLTIFSDLEQAVSDVTLPLRAEKFVEIQASFDLEYYRASIEGRHRLFDSVVSTGSAAIKSLFLINGGGCVALLALIGQLAQRLPLAGNTNVFAVPLLSFAIGVGAASFAACVLALAQKAFHEKHQRVGRVAGYITMLLGLMSLAAFRTGCYVTFTQFSQMR